MPVRVFGGKGTVLNHRDAFKKYGSKCLIVCGGSSAKLSGALGDVISALEGNEIQFTVCDFITQNPKVSDCHKAGELARNFGAEFIIGIGGGSQLDASKAVAVYAANESFLAEDIYTKPVRTPLPVILVGTTAGTGSEVTGVSVLTRESGKKKSVGGENYYAKLAFADPSYTYSVPYEFTVSTAVDAFSHAVESLFSNRADSNSEIYAQKAVKPIWECLKHFSSEHTLPSEEVRDTLYYSSLFAGMALNLTGTCFPHTLGYTLTEDYALPHGLACAAFLPAFVKRASEYKNELAQNFLSSLNTDYSEFEKVIFSLVDIKSIKMQKEQITAYCENWHRVKNFDNTPGGFSAEDAEKLLTELFCG